jgi:hypothetical protein
MSPLARLLFLVPLTILTALGDSLGDEVSALKLTFQNRRSLSSNELRLVLTLAHRAGLKRVTTVKVIGYPGHERQILLASDEVKKDRRISQESMLIRNADWFTDSSASAKGETLGKFSVDQLGNPVITSHWATFTFRGEPIRLQCPPETDLAVADRVLAALQARRIRYPVTEARIRSASMDFSSPTDISVGGDGFYIALKHKDPSCSDSITGRLEEDRLIIENAGTACS